MTFKQLLCALTLHRLWRAVNQFGGNNDWETDQQWKCHRCGRTWRPR